MRVLAIAGTRPEVIKLSPLMRALNRYPSEATMAMFVLRQQRDVLDRALQEWEIEPLSSLPFGFANGNPSEELFLSLENEFERWKPDCVVVQGDTNSSLTGALAASRSGVRCVHVEAGLRTGNERDPFPEESNRLRIATVTERHYAPTLQARRNLLREGYASDSIRVVGNTGVDALRISGNARVDEPIPERTIVVTGHRRENHGAGMNRICTAIRQIVERFDDVHVRFLLHPNPAAHHAPITKLSNHPRITLSRPLTYGQTIALLRCATLAITDSGGIQEEAPYLGLPVLITREATERPETLLTGTGLLVGSDTEHIVSAATSILQDPAVRRHMTRAHQPFGDGYAADRIRTDLLAHLQCQQSIAR